MTGFRRARGKSAEDHTIVTILITDKAMRFPSDFHEGSSTRCLTQSYSEGSGQVFSCLLSVVGYRQGAVPTTNSP